MAEVATVQWEEGAGPHVLEAVDLDSPVVADGGGQGEAAVFRQGLVAELDLWVLAAELGLLVDHVPPQVDADWVPDEGLATRLLSPAWMGQAKAD